MIEFQRPDGEALSRLRETFGEMATAAALLENSRTETYPRRVAASAVFAAARGAAPPEGLESSRPEHRARHAAYRAMIADAALYAFPMARAASSTAYPDRHADGCHISVEQSRAEPDQYFVVVRLTREAAAGRLPTALIVCDRDDRCRRFALPPARQGIAQLIADADSDLMRLMADPSTRVFLS